MTQACWFATIPLVLSATSCFTFEGGSWHSHIIYRYRYTCVLHDIALIIYIILYHIVIYISYVFIILCHIIYHIISYHIILYHIILYHIILTYCMIFQLNLNVCSSHTSKTWRLHVTVTLTVSLTDPYFMTVSLTERSTVKLTVRQSVRQGVRHDKTRLLLMK
jgi:hypothetical protein